MSPSLAILTLAAITLASRLAGPTLAARLPTTPRVTRTLDGIAQATLAALVAVALAEGGLREVWAALAAMVVMLLTGSTLAALITGVALAALSFHLGA